MKADYQYYVTSEKANRNANENAEYTDKEQKLQENDNANNNEDEMAEANEKNTL